MIDILDDVRELRDPFINEKIIYFQFFTKSAVIKNKIKHKERENKVRKDTRLREERFCRRERRVQSRKLAEKRVSFVSRVIARTASPNCYEIK